MYKELTPVINNALSYNQNGDILIYKNHQNVSGSKGGFEGVHSQEYIELIAGNECGNFTPADNTTGTLFYPELKYFTAFKNYTINTSDGSLVEIEISAKSIKGDAFNKVGTYLPGGTGSSGNHYMHVYHGDEVLGQFTRIAIFKMASFNYSGRVRIGKGPGSGKNGV